MNHPVKALSLLLVILAFSSCNYEPLSPEQYQIYQDIQSGTYVPPNENPPKSNEEILALTLSLPSAPFNYANPNLPRHFQGNNEQELDNTPVGNQVSNEGATLGRVLFYDKLLSVNNEIACASCHLQEHSFSDPRKLSLGFDDRETGRHSMSLANARYYENGRFFWDERASTLEDQVLMPIQDHIEMGMSLEALVPKLQTQDYYRILFEDVFGDTLVTSERISLALSQFVRSMVSYQSKFDQGLNMTNGPGNRALPNFSDLENLGLQIFGDPQKGGCAGCHSTPIQAGIEAQNNGLDRTSTDLGLGAVTGDRRDEGKFKVPSLRNVAVTGPYMHDGRFGTLAQVVEHYNSGVQAHQNLDPRLRLPGSNQPRRLNLNEEEKQALVAFLETLTDEYFLMDEKFANPFIR